MLHRKLTALAAVVLGVFTLSGNLLAADQPVTVTQDDTAFTLSNGTITAKVLKRNGDLISLVYNGAETLTDQSGHAGAYWSHDANSPTQVHKVTIDPASNGGERGEVSVKGISNGRRLGRPAGLAAGAEGDFPADIEIRYSLGRGDQGIYTYCILEHLPEYPAGSIGEARYCAKLAKTFDWLNIDEKRNKYYPREEPGEDKYVYCANQSDNRAYGWTSTKDKIGWWIVNPTIEYLSGGPTKVEFLCHRDTTQVQAPCVLNYWRSSHYGGAVLPVAQGEKWSKVVGPFMIYVNSGGDPQQLWQDAKAQAVKENKKWPYEWVSTPAYPTRKERADVTGQFVLNDPILPEAKMSGRLIVGLASPTYPMAGPNGSSRDITWQLDGKHYEFWADGDSKTGNFTIPHVNPGSYTLYAMADGVLGEYSKADVTVEKGKNVDLGKLNWTPVRRGKQVWQIGIPNRSAKEFAGGDKYFEPDAQLQYPKLFPNDVNFVVGKSDFTKDWYFEHIPHNEDPEARVLPFRGVSGNGKATPYAITFNMADTPKGKATLRFAFCAVAIRGFEVIVNDQSAGMVDRLPGGDSTITRHGIQGIQFERELSFDAALLKKGENTMKLVIPAGPLNSGVIYDCVRLELDQNAVPTAMAQ